MDEDLKKVFGEMKKQDLDQEIPDFKSLIQDQKPRFTWSIAASIVLVMASGMLLFFVSDTEEETALIDQVAIEYHSESLMTDETDLIDWESSTDYLLDY